MGEQDYLFLPIIQKIVKIHKMARLFVIPECGHVVNVERHEIFNENAIRFIQEN